MLEIGPNFICRPYRGVSFQEVDIALHEEAVRSYLIDRLVYRRTEFLVLARDGELAVAQVNKASTAPLFSRVTDMRYLAGPDEAVLVEDDSVDTGNASQMARAALTCHRDARIYVIKGRFQHVNFIVAPTPLYIRVVEVVPPEPPKLLEMARKVLDYDEELPPMEMEFVPIDLNDLAVKADGNELLFPCRSSGLDLDSPVHFLDAGPEQARQWTLIGCERSRQIHEFLYGTDPPQRIEMCPKKVDAPTDTPTLMKCCLIERGLELASTRAVVPWGASLEEVRSALHELAAKSLGDARE